MKKYNLIFISAKDFENKKLLTINKSYEIIDSFGPFVKTINDYNNEDWYAEELFITLKEYRKLKLKKLNEYYSIPNNI